MEKLTAVILAAGEGTRMKSKLPKVLHETAGKPMVKRVIETVKKLKDLEKCMLVIGHKGDVVKNAVGSNVEYVIQEEQLGTGHAVIQTKELLKSFEGNVLILCGDTPIITSNTLSSLIEEKGKKGYNGMILTAKIDNPTGYGRIIRDESGKVIKIKEEKDSSPEEKAIKEINSGIYVFERKLLFEALDEIGSNNKQGEYYLTDVVEVLSKKGYNIGALDTKQKEEIMGINNRIELSKASKILRQKKLDKLMLEGVTIIDPDSSYIDEEVEIGKDTIIYPGVIIQGKCKIGEDCILGPGANIIDSVLCKGVKVKNSIISESFIDDYANIGPFAYIRPESKIGKNVKIGDFVEIKKSTINENSKVPHLAYIGDSEIGKHVNMSAGVIMVNYDGFKKHKTVVKDNSFVGCNSNLISPVVIGEGAYIAAGSTITDDVPKDALGIARERQTNKKDWAKNNRIKQEGKDNG